MDEPALILDAQHGNLDAFNTLVLVYQDALFSNVMEARKQIAVSQKLIGGFASTAAYLDKPQERTLEAGEQVAREDGVLAEASSVSLVLGGKTVLELARFMQDWLETHIHEEDRPLVEYLRTWTGDTEEP